MEHADVNTKAHWCAPAEAYPGVIKNGTNQPIIPSQLLFLEQTDHSPKKEDSSVEFCLVRISDCFRLSVKYNAVKFPFQVFVYSLFLYSYPFLFFLSLSRFP